jgi:Tfp pilus assembly protein PilN
MSDNDINEIVARVKQAVIATGDNNSEDMRIQTRNSTISVCLTIIGVLGTALFFVLDARVDSRVESCNKPISLLQTQHSMKIDQHEKDIAESKSDLKEVKREVQKIALGVEQLLAKEK